VSYSHAHQAKKELEILQKLVQRHPVVDLNELTFTPSRRERVIGLWFLPSKFHDFLASRKIRKVLFGLQRDPFFGIFNSFESEFLSLKGGLCRVKNIQISERSLGIVDLLMTGYFKVL
jgi:hypothetical protein